jgi:hypothetical protein
VIGLAVVLAGPAGLFAQSPYAQRTQATGSVWATQATPQGNTTPVASQPTNLTPLPVASTPQASASPEQQPPLFRIQPTNFQPPLRPGEGRPLADDQRDRFYQIQLEPPGLERLASVVQTEETLKERIKQEAIERNPDDMKVTFPDSPILSRDTYNGRGSVWAPHYMTVEPYFLCHEKLLTEQINFERYGWDLGILSPVIGAGVFYLDVAMIPYNLATRPFDCADADTGLCLPGDPVPFLLYPPELSVTGTLAEAGVLIALVAMFP